MKRDLKAFNLNVNGKILDYRLGRELDLDEVENFFKRKYSINKLWQGGRHILGMVEKDGKELLLKLSTTEGISIVTRIEYEWNEQFNKHVPRKSSNFWVPQNYDSGLYKDNLFYLVTDIFNGELLAIRPEKLEISKPLPDRLLQIIAFSEFIQILPIHNVSVGENTNYRQWFVDKATAWYNDIPTKVIEEYKINDLLDLVKKYSSLLQKRPRHGDFTPWHIFSLETGQLGLIDGEHAKENGVEYYDIAYFIQRVHSVLENPDLANKIFGLLKEKGYDLDKLRIVLAARAIGGFLDESLKESPGYSLPKNLKDWVINL